MKYKNELAAIIAILAISTLAIALTPSATGYTGQATVTMTQSRVRDNALVLITITVNNTNTGAENVENILIRDETVDKLEAEKFTNPFGGNENVIDNWNQIGDNLLVVADNMVLVRDNLLLVVTYFKNAATNLQAYAVAEDKAGEDIRSSLAGDNNDVSLAGNEMVFASDDWAAAATALGIEPFEFDEVVENLRLAAAHESKAGGYMLKSVAGGGVTTAVASALDNAAENILDAANKVENYFADNLENTNIILAAYALDNIAENWVEAAWRLGSYGDDGVDPYLAQAADHIENEMVPALRLAAENLRCAANALDNAGEILSLIENGPLDNAKMIRARYARDIAGTVVTRTDEFLDNHFLDNLQDAAENLDNSYADNYDNITLFGDTLKNAAAALTADSWLGPRFASDLIGYAGESSTTSARYYLDKAADNLENENNLNITTAANNLYSFALQLEAAGTKLKESAALLSPTTGWGLEVNTLTGNNGILISPILGDNELLKNTSKTFSFFWQAPNISAAEETRTITVWTYGTVGGTENKPSTPTSFTVTVDGRHPYATDAAVQQEGVSVEGVVGRVYDDGYFTFTVTASEELSAIGDLYIDNRENEENLLPPFTLETYDDMTFTYTFDTTDWEDDWENLRVRIAAPWATDTYGLENAENLIENFIFDLRDPIFPAAGDNGLAGAGTMGALTQQRKPGTTDTYFRTNDKTWVVTVKAEDNWTGAEESWLTVSILANDVEVSAERTPEENTWDGELTLNEGVNSVTVRVTDRAGNSIENVLENVFCDNIRPSVSLVTVGSETWVDNTTEINENGKGGTPSGLYIKLAIQDSGWGIVRENIYVWLDNDDNLANGENILLENRSVWDNGEVGIFENYIENLVNNVSQGLRSGTWWVIVAVGDNVQSQGGAMENDNYSFKFTIDVDAPPIWGITAATNPLDGTAVGNPVIQRTNTVTLTGTNAEVGAKVRLYLNDVAQAQTESVLTDGSWSISGTLTEGIETKVEVTLEDAAGSESAKVLYGYVKVDSTAPTVSITSPATGYTTSDPSVTVNATVTDAVTESGDITVRVSAPGFANPVSQVYPDASGNITLTVPLAEGANEISVMCEDTAGNVSTASKITVTRTVTPWATYAAILAVVAVILAAIAVLRRR